MERNAAEKRVIASIFHNLTNGSTKYTPRWYEADMTVPDMLQEMNDSVQDLSGQLVAVLIWNFIAVDHGSGFQQTNIEQTHEKVMELLGSSVTAADVAVMRSRAETALKNTSMPFFMVLRESVAEQYITALTDVLLLNQYLNPDDMTLVQPPDTVLPGIRVSPSDVDGAQEDEWYDGTSPFIGSEDTAVEDVLDVLFPYSIDNIIEQGGISPFDGSQDTKAEEEIEEALDALFPYRIKDISEPDVTPEPQLSYMLELASRTISDDQLFEILMQVNDELTDPTDEGSMFFAHHPEMYFAWLLGTDAKTLTDEYEAAVHDVVLLPLPVNLQGTVLDKETRDPLSNVTVTITGRDTVQEHTTDAEGKWGTWVDPDNYQITYERGSYKTAKENVTKSMFGHAPITRETLMEKVNLPRVEAELGWLSYLGGSGWANEAIAQPREFGVTAPEISLTVTGRNTINEITIDCEWLEPYTINCAEIRADDTNSISAIYAADFTAVNMGDGSYTYILNLNSDGPTVHYKTIVLRESGDRLEPVLSVTLWGRTDTGYGLDGINDGFVDYNQVVPGSDLPYGIYSSFAYVREQADGMYDLYLSVTEADWSEGWRPTNNVTTRYQMINGELSMVEQEVK